MSDDLKDRYITAMHKVQTAIATLLGLNKAPFCDPKHLRVGIESAHATDAALADLLIAKGVFTETEYLEALAKRAEAEAESWQREIRAVLGSDKVTLG